MIPTFVIGLREGLEASLIVGIVAAFLRRSGRSDALKSMWIGVAAAVILCVIVGVGIQVLDASLPQAQQEGLETVVAIVAVFTVSAMVFWMKRHARGLKAALEESAADALALGTAAALVGMVFFAVLREGFETAVFVLAVFHATSAPAASGAGVVLGIACAVVLGYLIYRGGVHINLARFFRATGFVLVLVAAGLVASALHSAHEAGWLTVGQSQALNLTWLVSPGSIRAALLTGMLGLQPQPTVAEVAGWLLYAVPMAAFVLWPSTPKALRLTPVAVSEETAR